MKLSFVCNRAALGALWVAVLSWNVIAGEIGARDFKSLDLFQTTNLWTVHFQFTPEEWESMEPKGGRGGIFGMFGGGGAGPGGAGFRMLEGFGTGMFLAPGFLKAGDQNGDRKLSQEEFSALGEKWFSSWDTNHTGKLGPDQVRSGLDSVLGMPSMLGRDFLQGADGKRNGLASAMGIEFRYVHADMTFQDARLKDVAVRYKGNGTFVDSRDSLKRSLKLDLNKFVKGQKLAGLSKLNLHNNVTDASFMNEVLAFRLYRDAGVPAPRTAYARVFVTVPGKHERRYFGLYSLVEDVDQNFAAERFGVKKGAIFKPTTRSPFTDLGDDWRNYNQTYDPKTELTSAQQQRVIDFCKLVSKASDRDFQAKVGDYIDLEEFAGFMAVTVYLSSLDSILGTGQNYYLHLHPKSQKFQFIAWDQDHSFGDFLSDLSGGDPLGNLSIHRPWAGENRFLERIFKHADFKQVYLAKLNEFSKTIFKPERFHQQVDEIAGAIRPAVQEESDQKLARFDRVMAGETPAGFSLLPYKAPRKPIKAFVAPRAQSILDQLSGKTEGKAAGGYLFGGQGNAGFWGGGKGAPGAFGLGALVGKVFLTTLDSDKDGTLSRDEFVNGFAKWFKAWDTDHHGALTEEQLRAGMNKDLPLFAGGAGFGFPGGAPSRAQ